MPSQLVDRSRLLDLLDGVLTRSLTTVTAPAGFGKSVLAAQWCRQRAPIPVGWLRLGREDKDPDRLLARTLAAINHVCGATLTDEHVRRGDDELRLDQRALDRLTDAAGQFGESVLVVDGLRASGPTGLYADIAKALEQADHCGLHLMALSRCLPPPTLIALQLRGAVAHVTVDDLRLTTAETAALVHAYSGNPLRQETAAELVDRLDGWMAGAVLVGMSRSRADAGADELLRAATDSIDGYYQSEVIDSLPDHLRSFLVRTSSFDELEGALCDHVTGSSGGEETLQTMRRHGLPVFLGAERPGTFRYHRPLRAVLDARYRRQDADGRDAGLRAGADWYVERLRPLDAAAAYASLGDWDAVGEVVMAHAKELLESDQLARLAGLVANAPPAVLQQHTGWAVAGAALMMSAGRVAAANETLHFYEPHFGAAELMVADLIRADSKAWVEDMTVPVDAAVAALAAADSLGDAHRYTDLYSGPPSTTDFYRLSAHCKVAFGCALAGWWDRGAPHLVHISPEMAAGLPHVRHVQFRGERAVFLALAGEASAARAEGERALTIAAEAGITDNRNAAAAYWAVGEAFRLSGLPERAVEPLDRALALARVNGRHNLIAGVVASQVHLLVDIGDPSAALALVDAHRIETAHRPPETVAALFAAGHARALAGTGDVARAVDVLDRAPITSATASTAVRLALGSGERARAAAVLESWPRERTVLAGVRQSLALAMLQQVRGSATDALDRVRTGLKPASRADLVQPIVEWGTAIVRPLRRIARSDARSNLASLARQAEVLIEAGGTTTPRFTAQQAAVLAYLGQGLSVPVIAAEMYLSVNTVKTYVKAIYRKLGVSSRAEAVAVWQRSLSSDRGDHPASGE